MIADIGTKPLASERIKFLKKEMNLVQVPHPEEERNGRKKKKKEEGFKRQLLH